MTTHPIENLLEPGDILFTSIPNPLYRRVARATGSPTSHVGIAFHDPEIGWRVAESGVPTVRYTPLARFIARSDHGWLVVRRLRGGVSESQAEALRGYCDSHLGEFYHLGFDYASPRQFCSKFVYEAYRQALGIEIGTLETFRHLLNSQPNTPLLFWKLWFLGRIPWNRLTVTPASQLRSDKLDTVWESSQYINNPIGKGALGDFSAPYRNSA